MNQQRVLVTPNDAARLSNNEVGGKAAALARLWDAQAVAVPKFFVITTHALRVHLKENSLDWPGFTSGSAVAARRGREAIVEAPMASAVGSAIHGAYTALTDDKIAPIVAVRSSAAEEDAQSASYAGQFDSFLGVDASHLEESVKRCWASALSERAIQYRQQRGATADAAAQMAVIVQQQIFSEKAGVLFTIDPVTNDVEHMSIEANYGTGEAVLSGLVTPDLVRVDRQGHVVEERVANKIRMTVVDRTAGKSRVVPLEGPRARSRVLRPGEIEELVEAALRVESALGGPQDVEWAFDERQLWILQARPVTTGKSSPQLTDGPTPGVQP